MFFRGHCNLPLIGSGFRLCSVKEMLPYAEITMVCINIMTKKNTISCKVLQVQLP